MAARPKSSSSGSVKKLSWSPTMVESIIDSLKEYKACASSMPPTSTPTKSNYMKRFDK